MLLRVVAGTRFSSDSKVSLSHSPACHCVNSQQHYVVNIWQDWANVNPNSNMMCLNVFL